jgi:hypothetical protein
MAAQLRTIWKCFILIVFLSLLLHGCNRQKDAKIPSDQSQTGDISADSQLKNAGNQTDTSKPSKNIIQSQDKPVTVQEQSSTTGEKEEKKKKVKPAEPKRETATARGNEIASDTKEQTKKASPNEWQMDELEVDQGNKNSAHKTEKGSNIDKHGEKKKEAIDKNKGATEESIQKDNQIKIGNIEKHGGKKNRHIKKGKEKKEKNIDVNERKKQMSIEQHKLDQKKAMTGAMQRIHDAATSNKKEALFESKFKEDNSNRSSKIKDNFETKLKEKSKSFEKKSKNLNSSKFDKVSDMLKDDDDF